VIFVSKVLDVFHIKGRGVVIALDPETWTPDVKIRQDDKIQLRTPDGTSFEANIVSIGSLCGPNVRCKTGVALAADITAAQIPEGTEMRLVG